MKSLLAMILVCMVVVANGQDKKPQSPAAKAEGKIGAANITINYSAPSVRGRKIFGELEPFGKVWRTGANASTSIEFSAPVKIEGKDLAAGKYALFTIPGENEWTIIFNKTIKWGAFSYKQDEDVLRVTVKPSKIAGLVETLQISIEGEQVVIQWENTKVAFTVKG
ncbi:MAG: DUF2911 domain-containing protein [Cyclobacteriaceae bacterium]|nr:hypothetical protein [Cytophagales bacterium]HNP79073.1 DUF2911 domain-containing protein [Cyclobacteriaceae bacterium]HQQ82464.1 DUF2911 domain-containing protein [Cyclobacteriaceae bacterium]